MRTLLLHNPKAGDGRTTSDHLQAALSRSGCVVRCWAKDDDGYKAALSENWDLVAVAGGDGTVAKAARHLRDRDIPVAILPIGTAMNKGITLRMNQASVKRNLPRCIDHIEAGHINPKDVITHRIPLEEVSEAYHLFSSKLDECIKPMLIPPGARN